MTTHLDAAVTDVSQSWSLGSGLDSWFCLDINDLIDASLTKNTGCGEVGVGYLCLEVFAAVDDGLSCCDTVHRSMGYDRRCVLVILDSSRHPCANTSGRLWR